MATRRPLVTISGEIQELPTTDVASSTSARISGRWVPPGSAATLPGVYGYTALTAVGTATARVVATTNAFTRQRRLGYVSAALAGSLASVRVAVAQVTTGGVTGSGFRKIVRFGVSDAALVATARMFCGVSANTGAPTNVEPSTLTNVIGIGEGAANTNLHLFYGGTTAQAPINLGANFPTTATSTDVYELMLYAPAATASTVHYQVTRLNTGDIASGTLTGTAGVALPAVTTLLTPMVCWRSNNATAVAVAFDLFADTIEHDF
jgi:hypothetical protein